MSGNKRQRRQGSLLPPLRDALIFVVFYAFFFLVFRFDIRRYGGLGSNPMTAHTSAWLALVVAIIGVVYVRIKSH